MVDGRKVSLGPSGSPGSSQTKALSKSKIMYLAEVIAVDETYAANRIKVRLDGLDDGLTLEKIPWCFPFLPLYLNMVPKVGETAKIILYDSQNEQSYREYMGPLVPQLGELLVESPHFYDSRRGREGYLLNYNKSLKKVPTAKDGVYPNEQEIAIQGRDNADIIFKPAEVIIRASKFLKDKPYTKNVKNPAYIQIKTLNGAGTISSEEVESTPVAGFKSLLAQFKNNETRTDVNIVSNKIHLIGRDTDSTVVKPFFNEKEEETLENELHPLVYGDILKSFIKKLFNWVKNHNHPYHNITQNPAIPAYIDLELWMRNELPKLNSTNIFAGGDFPRTNNDKPNNATNDNSNNDNKVRDNSSIVREDETDQPEVKIDSRKICDQTKCRVEFDLINKVNGDVVQQIDGEGSTEVQAYTQAIISLTQSLITKGIKLSDMNIPPLTDIKTF
jgi:hypothetical protein